MKYDKKGEVEEGLPKIAVVIVHKAENIELAKKAQEIHHSRAGMPCEVYRVEDTKKEGWVKLQNQASSELDYDYYVYSCDDYFPGRDYLKIAYETLVSSGRQVLAFNDGKWHGAMATAALVDKRFIEKQGYLFYPKYKMSFGDAEISDRAMFEGVYAYNPEATLMEVDYYKESKPHANEKDRELYNRREVEWVKRWS